MFENILLNLKNELNRQGIILSFTGPFSQGIIEEIGNALKSYLKENRNNKGDIFRLFSIFIEQTQNINNYTMNLDEKNQNEVSSSGVMMIGEKNGKYFISSGNLIKNEDKKNLEIKLDNISNLEKKKLKKIYRKKLREEMKSKSGGADLGLLDMARKSSEKLEYSFDRRGKRFSFFTLTVYI
ncbi:MAG: SiaB family protein kinase [Fusobacteriota bacterium]